MELAVDLRLRRAPGEKPGVETIAEAEGTPAEAEVRAVALEPVMLTLVQDLDRPSVIQAEEPEAGGRTRRQLVRGLERLLRSVGVRFDPCVDRDTLLDLVMGFALTHHTDRGVRNLVRAIGGIVVRREYRARIAAGVAARRQEGLVATGGPRGAPWGFRVGRGGRLVRNADEERCVVVARKLREDGMSLQAVADELRRQGFRNRGSSGRFNKNGIRRMLGEGRN